ncbi:glutaredoxin family protein [Massilia antarctica]|nr:glutaredoxin family protein [Massilia antarctica]
MKRILFLALIAGGALYAYKSGRLSAGGSGAFDKDGKPLVMLFTSAECGEHCDKIRNELKKRVPAFQEVVLTEPDKKYKVDALPTVIAGKQRNVGDDVHALAGMLGEVLGKEALTRRERIVMANHFDAQDKPRVVLYGTKWCGYCKAQRELFEEKKIPFEDVDVEASEAGAIAYNALEGSGYPLTYVGYRRFGGYKEAEILAAVDELTKKPQANLR